MKAAGEREKMLAVRLCGERVLLRLASIGITRLADLGGRDPCGLMHQVILVAGPPIPHPPIAIAALHNPIKREHALPACRG